MGIKAHVACAVGKPANSNRQHARTFNAVYGGFAWYLRVFLQLSQRMVDTYMQIDPGRDVDAEFIDSKPGFLFGMTYADGKMIGIHADTILPFVIQNSSSALIVGELKTKWTITPAVLNRTGNFLDGPVPSSTAKSHAPSHDASACSILHVGQKQRLEKISCALVRDCSSLHAKSAAVVRCF